jgi:hypothetical protein
MGPGRGNRPASSEIVLKLQSERGLLFETLSFHR